MKETAATDAKSRKCLTELEEHHWGERALKALQSGTVSEAETTAWLKKKLQDA